MNSAERHPAACSSRLCAEFGSATVTPVCGNELMNVSRDSSRSRQVLALTDSFSETSKSSLKQDTWSVTKIQIMTGRSYTNIAPASRTPRPASFCPPDLAPYGNRKSAARALRRFHELFPSRYVILPASPSHLDDHWRSSPWGIVRKWPYGDQRPVPPFSPGLRFPHRCALGACRPSLLRLDGGMVQTDLHRGREPTVANVWRSRRDQRKKRLMDVLAVF